MSWRQLSERAGISKTRVRTILAGEHSCSLTAFSDLCEALGLQASAVLRAAEDQVEADREREGLPPLWELAAQVIPGDDPEAEARSRVE